MIASDHAAQDAAESTRDHARGQQRVIGTDQAAQERPEQETAVERQERGLSAESVHE